MVPANPDISLIVPTWRGDRHHLFDLLPGLVPSAAAEGAEVVVAVPAAEAREYEAFAKAYPAVTWAHSRPGRARQMNAGAAAPRGRWLLFLHVDSRLAPGWADAIRRAGTDSRTVGGCFRLALDSPDWRARVIERGVRLRVRLLGLPYGDQGLFVRRDVFDAMGGYRDLPLMEDLDLVRRLKRAGRLHRDSLTVSTSPRRWERDGWFRRSVVNPCLATLYCLGISPRVLARLYLRRPAVVTAILARAPWAPGKRRLTGRLTAEEAAALRTAIFADTVAAVRSLPGVATTVVCEPPEACQALTAIVGAGVEVIPQSSGDLGERMANAFDDLFSIGASSVVLVGSDLPDLPGRVIAAATRALARRGDRVVLGPASDGGYYLVGLKAPHPELFSGVDWGTERVLEQTAEKAARAALEVVRLETWHDLDEWADLERLAASEGTAAPRTRAWFASRRR